MVFGHVGCWGSLVLTRCRHKDVLALFDACFEASQANHKGTSTPAGEFSDVWIRGFVQEAQGFPLDMRHSVQHVHATSEVLNFIHDVAAITAEVRIAPRDYSSIATKGHE